MHTSLFLAALSTIAASPAHAHSYSGTVILELTMDRTEADFVSGTVHVDKVRVHACDSSYVDYPVDQTVDPVLGFGVLVSGGDLCGATWYFDSDIEIDGYDSKFGAFSLVSTDTTAWSSLEPTLVWTPLTSFSVTSGTMGGSGPAYFTDPL